ncbi:MAG: gliding motility protein GldB, partial [Tannerella sp.]|nr:gliding motility protein GldB [Tannerella sp.]
MQTKNKILFLFILTYLFPCCSGKQTYAEINPGLQIQRFDCDLYHYLIDNEPDSCLNKDSAFLNEFGKNVIRIGLPDSSGFYDRLKNFFSEPTLMKLYRDEQEKFTDISSINQELADGMAVLLQHFPALKQPELYFHVSGLNQNVIVTDDLLSISADKYMGVDYPLYQDFFYDYQRQLMSPDRIVPDALLGFLTANFHFKGKHEILLDNIVYQGKLRYFISQLLPERKIWEYVGYNAEQYAWCSSNEARIWKFILENK